MVIDFSKLYLCHSKETSRVAHMLRPILKAQSNNINVKYSADSKSGRPISLMLDKKLRMEISGFGQQILAKY